MARRCGSRSGYQDGCRCGPCREANREYIELYRHGHREASVVHLPPPPGGWATKGACRNSDPALFFNQRKPEPALAICKTCPVRLDCLAYATEHHLHGIWGGTTAKQRRMERAAVGTLEAAG